MNNDIYYTSSEECVLEVEYKIDSIDKVKVLCSFSIMRNIRYIVLHNIYENLLNKEFDNYVMQNSSIIFIVYTTKYRVNTIKNVTYVSDYKLGKTDAHFNDICVFEYNLEHEKECDILENEIERNVVELKNKMILIKINHVDPYNILGFKRLSNKMKELSHIVKVNYYWDTYMTQLCLTNPCCLNLCFGFVCKSSKTKNPKILRINKNGELFPYSISNSKYLLGFFNGKSININKDFHIVIDNYIALQKNIYNRYVIKWPFLFFPIGGILEYESK